uniref:Uncharacterized protein n=1 Tax=Amphimedon queenslandica TaxID=400682 RepID=A0A1X7U1I6_AMPQE
MDMDFNVIAIGEVSHDQPDDGLSGKPASKAPEVQPDDVVLIAIRKLTKEVHELPKRVAEAIVTNPNQKANIDGP